MSFLNYIPGVAHAKALTHLVFNDKEGAERTMETFHTKTPIVSHLVAGIAKVAGDDELAQKCWDGGNSSLNALPVVGHAKGIGHYVVGDIKGGNQAMVDATSTTLNMADGIPVVGHAKGIVHYVCGDVEGGNKSMKAATRTTAVMGAGAGGFLIGGPVGAVAGGVGAGAEWDLVVAAATDGKEVNGIAKIVDNPKSVDSYFDAGLSVLGDGMAGYSGGKIAKQVDRAVNNIGKHGNAENAGAAAAQQLVDELDAGRITFDEYNQKWNEIKPKGGFNNAPVKDANQAVKGMAKDVGQGVAANTGPSSASGSQQPPQQPTDKKKTDLSEPELRQQLSKRLTDIRQRMLQDTGSAWSPADRQFQRESFHEIHTIVSELLSNGYSASIQPSNYSIANLVISSPDGSWFVAIEYQVADYLDVHDQLIRQQFTLNRQLSCPTVLSATFDGPQLVLSPLMDHEGDTNVIYGIRCRICDRQLGPGNISYVGQTTRSVHARVCGEHARSVASTINGRLSEDAPFRPMYEHAANHFRQHNLPQNTQPRDAFREVMDVILLPTGSDANLFSWESFWQFFCHCRMFFLGWSQR